jgi:serine/threonine-protein kinase SRPK3
VTIKIVVSEIGLRSSELDICRLLSAASSNHPGSKHVAQLLDDFQLTGPNGTHACLVFEVLGPNAKTAADHSADGRLPGDVAWEASRQILLGLDYLHQHGVGHGGEFHHSAL